MTPTIRIACTEVHNKDTTNYIRTEILNESKCSVGMHRPHSIYGIFPHSHSTLKKKWKYNANIAQGECEQANREYV